MSYQIYNFFHGFLSLSPGNYFEIGIFDGEGIASLANSFPLKNFYAIDPFIEDGHTGAVTHLQRGESIVEIRNRALENIHGYPIFLYETKSLDFLSKLTDIEIDMMNINGITIDGSHNYDDIIVDIELSMQLLNGKPDCAIFFDDLHIPDVCRAVNKFDSMCNMKRIQIAESMVAFIGEAR